MARTYLTDEQIWTILTAADSVTSVSLARAFGVSETAVRATRIKYRSTPWTCRVEFSTCEWCGLPMIRRGFKATHSRFHPACRPQARLELGKVHHQARMERASETARVQLVDRLHEYDAEAQCNSRSVAINHRKPWSAVEDAVVLEHPGRTDLDVALELGRSLRAVRRRRHFLVHGD